MPLPTFKESHLRRIAEILADAATHRELTVLLAQCGIAEEGGNPKWERILLGLSRRQQKDRCGNNVGMFVQEVLDPARFSGREDEYNELRDQLNEILAFSGLHLGENGKLTTVDQAATISEAQERAGRLRRELTARKVHPDVLSFCKPELVDQNYFHAVFEATKSVAEKIRSRSGLTSDGSALVDQAFGGSQPRLAINSLQTETEQSEQRGFVNLVKGMFGTFRNVTAHAPKITWSIDETDALDLLTLVSYLHRRIDAAARTPWN